VHHARVIVVLVLFVATKAVECPDTISFSGVFRMAFNGDGPHSKRQRLEESGHRVSTRLLHDRGPRAVPGVPPRELRPARFTFRCSAPIRWRPLVVPAAALARVFTRGRRVAIYRRNDRAREQRRRVSRRVHGVPGVQCASGAPFTRDFPTSPVTVRVHGGGVCVRRGATRRDATRRRLARSLARAR